MFMLMLHKKMGWHLMNVYVYVTHAKMMAMKNYKEIFMVMLHKKMMALNECLCQCYICEDDGNEKTVYVNVTQEDSDNKKMFM
jgi:hypothetical protein